MPKGLKENTIMVLIFMFMGLSSMALLSTAFNAATVTSKSDLVNSAPANVLCKIEQTLLDKISEDEGVQFFVWMDEKADLSPAYRLNTKEEMGRFVFDTLKSVAEKTQKRLIADLESRGIRYKSFYISNKILVLDGDVATILAIASRSDVSQITANHQYQLPEPYRYPASRAHVTALESNITFVNADDAWAVGYTGKNTVLAGNDTGLDEDHPAIAAQYRGCLNPPTCSVKDHNYNWWDATGTYPTDPWDGYGHGTHTTGTMVGKDLGAFNQIGVAPGARTIHCKNMTNSGSGTDATFTECFQWDLAPWDLNGQNPDPDMAPDAVNNSWGYWGGGNPVFRDEIAALHAAGILVEVSSGNEGGSGCGTLRSPSDYEEVLTTGSVDHSGGVMPGVISYFSSKGPSALDPGYFPDIMAPGENIRSSLPGNTYASWGGTSMAVPHTTGLAGLIWDANPGLRGLVHETMDIIRRTAIPLSGQTGDSCGGDYDVGPNNDWGYGTIDAFAAVQLALAFGDPATLSGVVTDATSEDHIANAQINVQNSGPPYWAWTDHTDLSGHYNMVILAGTYDVSASAYGYSSETINDYYVPPDTLGTTLDFALDPSEIVTMDGNVSDGSGGGWPLYARIDVIADSFPFNTTVFTTPDTGDYSLDLFAGAEYTYTVTGMPPGYLPETRPVIPPPGGGSEDFALIGGCGAPGYYVEYFFDDFESGYANWTLDGLWNPETETDSCGSLAAPFPSSDNAAYYGQDTVCTFDTGAANQGSLTMNTPVPLPPDAGFILQFRSYEVTECGGYCSFDNRYVEVSIDGGTTWLLLGECGQESQWYQKGFDLSAYAGESVLIRFRFDTTDDMYNSYFGWMVDDVRILLCAAPDSGGLVVGNVYSENTQEPVNNALVDDGLGHSATTVATPDDLNVDDGFYQLYVPTGSHYLTANASGYGLDSRAVTVVDHGTVRQDFYLPAGWLTVPGSIEGDPTPLEVWLMSEGSTTRDLQLSNIGGEDLNFSFFEVNSPLLTTLDVMAYASPNNEFTELCDVGPSSIRSLTAISARTELSTQGDGLPTASDWHAASSMPSGAGVVRYAHAQCSCAEDSFYVISGVDETFSPTANTWRYDADTDTWNPLSPFPSPAEGPSAVCYNGLIYVAGGGATNQFYVYDIVGDSWAPLPPLPRNVWGAAMGAWDNKIFIIGGDNNFIFGGTSNHVDIYDIDAGTWATGTPMPTAAVTAGHVQAGPYLYVVGGWNDASPTNNVNVTQRYDMASDTWETGPAFSSARADFALAITSQYLYAIAGDADGGGPFDPTSLVERLDHSAWPGGIWTDIIDPLPRPLTSGNAGYTTIGVTGGEVWHVGGFNGFAVTGINSYRSSEPCFGSGIPWLNEAPASGDIPSGGNLTSIFTFDAAGYSEATYEGYVKILDDTPNIPIDVPVIMHVMDFADLPVRLETPTDYFPNITTAYNAAQYDAVIQCRAQQFVGEHIFNRPNQVTLYGGYDYDFTTPTAGMTEIKGSAVFSGGPVTVFNLLIGP